MDGTAAALIGSVIVNVISLATLWINYNAKRQEFTQNDGVKLRAELYARIRELEKALEEKDDEHRSEIKEIVKEHKEEIIALKKEHREEVALLRQRIVSLETEQQTWRSHAPARLEAMKKDIKGEVDSKVDAVKQELKDEINTHL